MDLLYWIWLSQAFVIGSDKPNQIIAEFGSPKAFYDNGLEHAEDLGYLSPSEISKMRRTSLERAEFIIKECKRLEIRILTQEDEEYPNRLKEIFAAPLVLYVKGELSGLDEEPVLAVVGTRKASDYGQRVTGNISYELAKAGAVVVSGCAVGVDSYAHLGALKAGGRTIAVLGCGLDVDYPSPHTELKRQILLKHGALVSELPPGTEPAPAVFPVRNRIMAGLSLGVLITEAPEHSGSLITAQHAVEQGKDVFCIPPCDIYSPKHSGVIRYIRDGASVVFCAKDILYEYMTEYSNKLNIDRLLDDYASGKNGKTVKTAQEDKRPQEGAQRPAQEKEKTVLEEDISAKPVPPADLKGKKLLVYQALEYKPVPVDVIAEMTGLEVKDVLAILTELEIVGLIYSMSGSRYGLLNK